MHTKPKLTDIAQMNPRKLHAGDMLLLSGELYTARDAAHKRMCEAITCGKPLPFDVRGKLIYFCGPTPAPPGKPIGSCGPTTSSRMNSYSPIMFEHGIAGVIGKGAMSEGVTQAIVKHGGVYLATLGGAGALLANCVKSCELVAYEDLGAEAICRLYVEEFPAIVAVDHTGNCILK